MLLKVGLESGDGEVSRLDHLYARWANRRPSFHEGWGAPIPGWPAIEPTPVRVEWDRTSWLFRSGTFRSPVPGLPDRCSRGHLEWWMPPGAGRDTPVCLHFAATGDEGYLFRRVVALPLLRRGIGSLILENPYYGVRRPTGQSGTRLRSFSDLWTMGTTTVAEGVSLLAWLADQGYRRLGVAGVSMGGQVAALVASHWARPVATVAYVCPHNSEVVFTRGAMRISCDWEALGGEEAAVPRLRELLSATDLRAFPPPARPRSSILVAAQFDAYVPRWSADLLHQAWPGSTLRWLPTGHVGAALFYRGAFRRAVADAFAALEDA